MAYIGMAHIVVACIVRAYMLMAGRPVLLPDGRRTKPRGRPALLPGGCRSKPRRARLPSDGLHIIMHGLYIVMAYLIMTYIVIYSYGLYSYGAYSKGMYGTVMVCIVLACI